MLFSLNVSKRNDRRRKEKKEREEGKRRKGDRGAQKSFPPANLFRGGSLRYRKFAADRHRHTGGGIIFAVEINHGSAEPFLDARNWLSAGVAKV